MDFFNGGWGSDQSIRTLTGSAQQFDRLWGFSANGLLQLDQNKYNIYAIPVHAPYAGQVIAEVDDLPGMQVPQADREHMAGNHVLLLCNDADALQRHFKPGSLKVRKVIRSLSARRWGLLAALAACMIKGIERVAPILKFELRGVEVRVHGVRQDVPPRMESISYVIEVDTDEPDNRLAPLHGNVNKYGTVFNTVAPGTDLSGLLVRKNLI